MFFLKLALPYSKAIRDDTVTKSESPVWSRVVVCVVLFPKQQSLFFWVTALFQTSWTGLTRWKLQSLEGIIHLQCVRVWTFEETFTHLGFDIKILNYCAIITGSLS